MTTTTLCRWCGKRFEVKFRAGRNTYRRHRSKTDKHSFALYCSDACRKAASRKRLGTRSSVTNADMGPTVRSTVTSPLRLVDIVEDSSTKKTVLDRPEQRFWVWRDRLDGSSDLYCDTFTTSQHVARIVWCNGAFHLTKPDVPSPSWTTRAAAQRAVKAIARGLLDRRTKRGDAAMPAMRAAA